MPVKHCRPKLISFYIFNSRFGQREGQEHEKLLYYSPASDDLNTQVRNIGLSEAFTRFTSMFNKVSDCETVHTQQHCTVMLQPEHSIWIVMKVALAKTCKETSSKSGSACNSKDMRKKRVRPTKPTSKSSPVNILRKSRESRDESSPRRQTSSPRNSPISGDGQSVNNSPSTTDPIDRHCINNRNSTNNYYHEPSGADGPDTDGRTAADDTVTVGSVDKVSCDSLDTKDTSSENAGSREYLNTSTASSRSSEPDRLRPPTRNSTVSGSRSDITASDSGSVRSHGSAVEDENQTVNQKSRQSKTLEEEEDSAITSTTRYHSNSVQTTVLKAHLRSAYSAFAFLNHSFGYSLEQLGSVDKLRDLMKSFFDDYLTRVDMSCGDVGDVWCGLSFLPLTQATFLRVYCCLAALRTALPVVRATAFLYTASVVWCDFDLESLRRLVHYLRYTGAFAAGGDGRDTPPTDAGYMKRFIGGVCGSVRVFVGSGRGSMGGAVTSAASSNQSTTGGGGASTVNSQHYDTSTSTGASSTTASGTGASSSTTSSTGATREASDLPQSDGRKECQLILYTCAGAIIPMVLPGGDRLQPSLYEKLARLLDSRVSQLTADLATIQSRAPRTSHTVTNSNITSNETFKFIYHNKMNLAVKSTISVEKQSFTGSLDDDDEDVDDKPSVGGWWFAKSGGVVDGAAGGSGGGQGSAAGVPYSAAGGPHGVGGGAFGIGGGIAVNSAAASCGVLPWKVMQTIVDMQADMERYGLHEAVLKTVDDHWVVGEAGNGRQLFVSMTQSSANLVEITDEVHRMRNSHFSNVFMLE